ncbi:MAG TPA: hypothetical protein VHA56_10850 [Mucilaginibacter sp.]|nr:hypothetical protein [Mucilaginibacter sp.]
MSSHHIVREKQEPALLLLGLDHFDEEMLGQLLEWSPTVIAVPQTAEKLNSLGIKIDWLVADAANEAIQPDVKMVVADGEDITQTILDFLIAHGYPTVNIVTDNADLNRLLPYVTQIGLVIFNGGKRIFPVTNGFSKWKPAGEIIEVLTPAKHLSVSGLADIGNGRYQTQRDGIFSLRFEGKFLFLAESF